MQTSATSVEKTSLGWYLDRIKSTPLLSAKQERELSQRIRGQSDHLAREQMIAANLRLVVRIAKDYSNPSMTLGDLVAEGNIGLMRAVEEFDPDMGVRFSTYAAWWIKQAIKRAMITAGQPVRIPAYLNKLISKWRKTAGAIEVELGRAPTTEEMAKKLHISLKRAELVRQGLDAVANPSFINQDSSVSMGRMLIDRIDSPDQPMLDASNLPIVRSLLEKLEPRERRILELRYGLDGYEGPMRTFKQIGQEIGLTRERVRQLEKKALGDLKRLAENTL